MRVVLSALCVSILFILPVQVKAQEGSPLLTHFRHDREVENQNWAICQDTLKLMYFANRKGILVFDGEEWIPVRLPVTPFTMKSNPSDKRIYIGAENSYGYLEKGPGFTFTYREISDTVKTGVITNILFADTIACFFGDNSASFHNPDGKLLYRFYPEPGTTFSGALAVAGEIFLNETGKGIFRIAQNSLVPLRGNQLPKSEILFQLPYNKNIVLAGTADGRLFLFDGFKFSEFRIKDDDYLRENILSDGIMLGDSLYAFSTLGGGALVCNKKGNTKCIINNVKGLPDDEIFAIGSDASGGLWLSHPLGLTRADLNLPALNFGIYPGLEGNPFTAVRYENELYVATSEGIFYLANEKRYTEIEVIKRNEIKSVPPPTTIPDKQKSEKASSLIPISSQPAPRKGFFARVFRKNEDTDSEQVIVNKDDQRSFIPVAEIPIASYTTEKIKKLVSTDYVYKKVSGLNEKSRQLVPTKNGILAATNRGLYQIKDHKASSIVPGRYINYISWNEEEGTYCVGASDGFFIVAPKAGKWIIENTDYNFRYPVYSITRTSRNTLWIGTDNAAVRLEMNEPGVQNQYTRYSVENPFNQRYIVRSVNDTLFLLAETGISRFDENTDAFIPCITNEFVDISYKYPVSNIPLIIADDKVLYYSDNRWMQDNDFSILKLFEDVSSVYISDDYLWVVDGENRLFGIDNIRQTPIVETGIIIKNFSTEGGESTVLPEIILAKGENSFNFEAIVPVFLNKNLTKYQYFIDGLMDDWSPWSSDNRYSRVIPEAGNYTLHIRAMDFRGNVGDPVSLNVTVKAPFTKTTLFYMLIIMVGLGLIFLILRFREKQLFLKNKLLEEKVKERTAEIEAQKSEITSSIEYASRIQLAMLPVTGIFSETFTEYFIIFKPRDIVSGDFYWIGADDRNLYLTVADCTGHGVPGAFMSTLGISILNEIVTHNRNLPANIFLNILREKIKIALHQTGKEGEAADGMDISLVVLSRNKQKLQYAGAYNPLLIYTSGELKEIKADRMPIGIHYGIEASFTNNELHIKKGDIIYLLSDGFADQFGGPDGCKYKKSQLKKLLSEIYMRPMSEQRKLIELEFLKWKGDNEQIDDITCIGVRI